MVPSQRCGSNATADTHDELVGALAKVLGDTPFRERLAQGARRTPAELTWDRTAYETLAVLAAAAARRTG